MMRVSDGQLQPMKGDDMKVKLHNDVLADMQSGGSLIRSNVKPSEGEKIFKKVADAIWYLDGRKETINEASRKRKRGEIIPTPTRFDKFSNYQNWKKWK